MLIKMKGGDKVIEIGGIAIDKESEISSIEQLQEGFEGVGVDTLTGLITWISELGLSDRIKFAQIVGEYGVDTVVSFFTFGIM